MNKVILIGNLGHEPKVSGTSSGTERCTFSIATSEQWVKDGRKQERTDWHNIVVWGKQAAACGEYLRKGSKVCVDGKIVPREYEKDGDTKYVTEIIANFVEFLDGKADREQSDAEPDRPPPKPRGGKDRTRPVAPEDDEDSLPF